MHRYWIRETNVQNTLLISVLLLTLHIEHERRVFAFTSLTHLSYERKFLNDLTQSILSLLYSSWINLRDTHSRVRHLRRRLPNLQKFLSWRSSEIDIFDWKLTKNISTYEDILFFLRISSRIDVDWNQIEDNILQKLSLDISFNRSIRFVKYLSATGLLPLDRKWNPCHLGSSLMYQYHIQTDLIITIRVPFCSCRWSYLRLLLLRTTLRDPNFSLFLKWPWTLHLLL